MSAITLYNGFYISSDQHLGTSDTSGITAEQLNNARMIMQFFLAQGWTKNAVSGMLGNMQVESYINPGFTETKLPDLESNSDMMDYARGVGLVQWTGFTPSGNQKMVQYAESIGLNWYDGNAQLQRILYEYQNNIQFEEVTVDGNTYNWNDYVISDESPSKLAKVFQYGYEKGGTDTERRQQNAEYWFRAALGGIPAWLLAVVANKQKRGRQIIQRKKVIRRV